MNVEKQRPAAAMKMISLNVKLLFKKSLVVCKNVFVLLIVMKFDTAKIILIELVEKSLLVMCYHLKLY